MASRGAVNQADKLTYHDLVVFFVRCLHARWFICSRHFQQNIGFDEFGTPIERIAFANHMDRNAIFKYAVCVYWSTFKYTVGVSALSFLYVRIIFISLFRGRTMTVTVSC